MFSARMIEKGSNRPLNCPDTVWNAVCELLDSGAARVVIVGFSISKTDFSGGWFYKVHRARRLVVDEHSGPHLLLAEEDTAQTF
jgi:hypothetical protein